MSSLNTLSFIAPPNWVALSHQKDLGSELDFIGYAINLPPNALNEELLDQTGPKTSNLVQFESPPKPVILPKVSTSCYSDYASN
jgi:hypothetical protein